MKYKRKIGCFLFTIKTAGLLLFIFCLLAYAQQEKEKRITDQERKLKQLEEEIDKYRAKAKEYGSEEKSVLTQLESLEINYRLKSAELQKLNIELMKVSGKIERISKEIQRLKGTVDELRIYIKNRLISLYKLGRLAYFRYMLSLKNPADLLSCYKYVMILSERDAQKITEFQENVKKLLLSQQSLARNQKVLMNIKAEVVKKRAEISKARKERQQYLSSIQQRRELYTKALVDLEQASYKLKLLIEGLKAGGEAEEGPPYLLNIVNFKGLLNWPVNGKVILPFGKAKHPKFNTYIIQNGLDIAVAKGAIIYSIFDGKVLYADWFKTYGNLLIIDHLNGFWSFYAHLEKFMITPKQWVERDQPIAVAGDTGSLRGYCLHFEIRKKGVPLDPQEWLKKREAQ